MKLRNIFLAGLAVATMASCSKDETIDYSQMGEVDAYVSFAAASVTSTKADTEAGTDTENYVNTLTAYVFYKGADDANSKLAGVKHLSYDNAADYLKDEKKGLIGIDHITVKVTPNAAGTSSTDQFVAVLVANAAQVNASNLQALKEAVITDDIKEYAYAAVKNGTKYLPMASAEIKFSGLTPNIVTATGGNGTSTEYTENWLSSKNGSIEIVKEVSVTGDPAVVPTGVSSITITRLVARVQVEGVKVNFNPTYPGAKFELQNLSVVNVNSQANILTGIAPYVKGHESAGYDYDEENAKSWIAPNSNWNDYQSILGKGYTGITLDSESSTTNPEEKKWADADTDKFYAYIFSNPEVGDGTTGIYQTALLISGKFYRNSADQTGEVRNFRIFLQDTQSTPVGPIMVIPNNVYKLNVTITGEGSPNEDEILLNAHVAATIDVAPWNVIIQEEDDTN